jgi:ABC-2 type transport system ATP-binding protein/lipopolysaccharide transport system ATP-binding protein
MKEYVIRLVKRQLLFKEFWAVKDLSFTIRRGERVGLIGHNGSGKSTTLKMVCGVLKPTKGRVSVRGKVAPLLELGAGFDYNLTARENVFLNGAILGFSRSKMRDRYENIMEFAELKEFEDVALKNFSTGMVARLGFAIATCYDPDILIIDEILSVGDRDFQAKCHERIDELIGRGTTILFVSHSDDKIINICERVIWLDHGNMVADGEARGIIERYENNG